MQIGGCQQSFFTWIFTTSITTHAAHCSTTCLVLLIVSFGGQMPQRKGQQEYIDGECVRLYRPLQFSFKCIVRILPHADFPLEKKSKYRTAHGIIREHVTLWLLPCSIVLAKKPTWTKLQFHQVSLLLGQIIGLVVVGDFGVISPWLDFWKNI